MYYSYLIIFVIPVITHQTPEELNLSLIKKKNLLSSVSARPLLSKGLIDSKVYIFCYTF